MFCQELAVQLRRDVLPSLVDADIKLLCIGSKMHVVQTRIAPRERRLTPPPTHPATPLRSWHPGDGQEVLRPRGLPSTTLVH